MFSLSLPHSFTNLSLSLSLSLFCDLFLAFSLSNFTLSPCNPFLSHFSSLREREKSLLPPSHNVFLLLPFPLVFLFFFLALFLVLSFASLPSPSSFLLCFGLSLFPSDSRSLARERKRESLFSPSLSLPRPL